MQDLKPIKKAIILYAVVTVIEQLLIKKNISRVKNIFRQKRAFYD